MMANGGRFPSYASRELECEILALPYKQNQSTMYIIMPNDSNRQKLIELQSKLTSNALEDMISRMSVKTSVILMPKLHLDTQVNLRSTLMKMGIHDLFDIQKSDLSLISGMDLPSAPQQGAANIDAKTVRNNVAQQHQDYLIFSRVGEEGEGDEHKMRRKRHVTYKTESDKSTLTLKDLVINKRITKSFPGKKTRKTREISDTSSADLKNFDDLRNSGNLKNPGLFADDVLHRVNIIVNEKGTEAGAGKFKGTYS